MIGVLIECCHDLLRTRHWIVAAIVADQKREDVVYVHRVNRRFILGRGHGSMATGRWRLNTLCWPLQCGFQG